MNYIIGRLYIVQPFKLIYGNYIENSFTTDFLEFLKY